MSASRLIEDLGRARTAVVEADLAISPSERFLAAYLAALRVAAILLSLRVVSVSGSKRARPRNPWRMVAEAAPEFGEWAAFFGTRQPKFEAVRAGATAIVTAREADDLVRDSMRFLALVEKALARQAAGPRDGSVASEGSSTKLG